MEKVSILGFPTLGPWSHFMVNFFAYVYSIQQKHANEWNLRTFFFELLQVGWN